MKKISFLLASIIVVICYSNADAATIKKTFFDRNLKYVEHEEFAHFYRVELHPDVASEPIVYRFYSMEKKLLAEGTATILDEKDHSKSIYIGENISYYNNGNIAERFILDTPGPLADADYYEAFDENKRLIVKGSIKGETMNGEIFDYEDDGRIYHYFMKNGVIDGRFELYINDKLYLTSSYAGGKEEGLRNTYYPSGKLSSSVIISNDLLNGLYESFDENGRTVCRIPYKNGVIVGEMTLQMTDINGAQSFNYYAMQSSPGAPLFISVYAHKTEYTVDSRRLRTKRGDRISGRHDHFNILRYDLFIQNLTDHPIDACINDVSVITYKTDPKYGVDIYIDEKTSIDICKNHYSYEKDIAMENAAATAESAATTTSSSVGVQNSVGSASYNKTSRTSSAIVGTAVNRFGATGSSGYIFGGSIGGWAALGHSTTKTSATASTSSTSFYYQRTNSFDGAVYYEVLERETAKAMDYISAVKQHSEDEVERLIISSFTIPAKGYIQREILASENLSDIIVLSFNINGDNYALSINN